MRSYVLWGALAALAMVADVTVGVAQDKLPQQPLRTVEIAQGANKVTYTEVLPHVWVRGQPNKPITSGSFLIIPEAYDYLPMPGGGGR